MSEEGNMSRKSKLFVPMTTFFVFLGMVGINPILGYFSQNDPIKDNISLDFCESYRCICISREKLHRSIAIPEKGKKRLYGKDAQSFC